MLFTVYDYKNIPVRLTKTTWFHKLLDPVFGHPEIKHFKKQIPSVIQNPEYVYQSIRDTRSKLFFVKIKTGTFASYFLCVVIKYVKENNKLVGYISTIMINRRLPKHSMLIWENKNST